MVAEHFSTVKTWVFDLDNTLYPPEVRLFDQIEVRMIAWIRRELGIGATEANVLRRDYWLRYGTTLAGLMTEHGVDPAGYLTEVHEIDFSVLPRDPDLARAIAALPGRKIIYTNGSAPYAERVAAARGLDGLFDAIYGVEHAGFHPKPVREAFDTVFAADGLTGPEAAMFEDDPRNLEVPHALGMRTIHVAPEADARPYIHHHTADLGGFLSQLGGPVAAVRAG